MLCRVHTIIPPQRGVNSELCWVCALFRVTSKYTVTLNNTFPPSLFPNFLPSLPPSLSPFLPPIFCSSLPPFLSPFLPLPLPSSFSPFLLLYIQCSYFTYFPSSSLRLYFAIKRLSYDFFPNNGIFLPSKEICTATPNRRVKPHNYHQITLCTSSMGIA